MHKKYLATAAVMGGLAVALGAFGAHGLEKITNDPKIIHGFQTGVEYQMYHALALLGVAIMFDKLQDRWIHWAANCFITGVILFSGSLYLLSFLQIQESSAVRMAGPLTPVGGVFLILGWLFLLMAAVRKK
jgi:uncharacterized membrane protein YgdD (TMEM256/DUF423 family)